METTELSDKDEEEIQKASKVDDEIQAIKRNLDEGEKEIRGIALGLCQWKDSDDLLWYQGKIWIPNDKGIQITLITKHYDPLQAGHGGTAKTTELISRLYYGPKIREDIKRFIKNCDTCQSTKVVRHAPSGLPLQMTPPIDHGNRLLWTSLRTYQNQIDMTRYWLSSIGWPKWGISSLARKIWMHGSLPISLWKR